MPTSRPTLLAASVFAVFFISCTLHAAQLREPTSSAPTDIAGVRWESSFAAGLKRGKAEGKPVLLLQMFGRLDDDLC
jgi:hypothetical protein